jgi:hypothetical protein
MDSDSSVTMTRPDRMTIAPLWIPAAMPVSAPSVETNPSCIPNTVSRSLLRMNPDIRPLNLLLMPHRFMRPLEVPLPICVPCRGMATIRRNMGHIVVGNVPG